MRKVLALLLLVVGLPFSTVAATSLSISGYNDYLFNGISLTQKNPALQGALDWSHDSGVYSGLWLGNVDLYDADAEVDVYAGYSRPLSSNWALDVGVAKYTYWGDPSSDGMNYAETHAAISYRDTTLTTWYAWDYFGTGAGHFIVKLAQNVPITDNASLYLAVDRSQTLNNEKWAWEDKNYYIHWEVTGNYALQGFNLSAGVHSTTLSTFGDTRLLFGVSKSFSF
ncbi:hypothetical protein JYB87_16440 [Shewanella avicenniae]|uniref:Uncharacterized protein n=1 Tax=Shewanella avicenniae TaxID=2814294 RepID=A0ABX7QQI3_9GAMM|nr:TorF family putative porin [Shewanella avicenniae]QSX33292.1 hypothetical protein JYB87_16440 [Shewanella avicenniae]